MLNWLVLTLVATSSGFLAPRMTRPWSLLSERPIGWLRLRATKQQHEELLHQANDSQLYTILRELEETTLFRQFETTVADNHAFQTAEEKNTKTETNNHQMTNDDDDDDECEEEECEINWDLMPTFDATPKSHEKENIQMTNADDDDECEEEECEINWDLMPTFDATSSNEETQDSQMSATEDNDECEEEECEINWDLMPSVDADNDDKMSTEDDECEEEECEINWDLMPSVDSTKDDSHDKTSMDDECEEEECEINWDMMPTMDAAKDDNDGEMDDDCEEEECEINWDLMPGFDAAAADEVETTTGAPSSPLFWGDLSQTLYQDFNKSNMRKTTVDLVLNPEINTGYDGSHIWHKMYRIVGQTSNNNGAMDVLYRLLSGMHTSTTLSIAKNYFAPSKRKGREGWEPNLAYYQKKFVLDENNRNAYIDNLHFSMLVLLRAMQKASRYLYDYDKVAPKNKISSPSSETQRSIQLLRRFLDTSELISSQKAVFEAFDESTMLQDTDTEAFKLTFQEVSGCLGLIQCQQCKLHGKLVMMGYGAALKILLTPTQDLLQGGAALLSHNDIVALINTVAKFSHSLKDLESLNAGLVAQKEEPSIVSMDDLVEVAVGLVSRLARDGHIASKADEMDLVRRALKRDKDLLLLAKHYSQSPLMFWQMAKTTPTTTMPDAIVVGSGLAGMTTALQILDRGGSVVIVEKEKYVGGNSNKASSGINAYRPPSDEKTPNRDWLESFYRDTRKAAGKQGQPDLIKILVRNSTAAVDWLKDRAGVDLSAIAQLGGHSHKRTHRPTNGMVGAEIMFGIQKAVRSYESKGRVKMLLNTRVTQLLQEEEHGVVGVKYQTTNGKTQEIRGKNVVLATGGFSYDRTEGSFLSKYRPEFLGMATTSGPYSTGDGVTLATSLGAGTIDMDKVQIHPTGFVDPADVNNPSKVLAGEVLRGIGGFLLNATGQRFCNELGPRDYVTGCMLSHHPEYAQTKSWDSSKEVPTFTMVLTSIAAREAQNHIDRYVRKGLLVRLENGAEALAEWMGMNDSSAIRTTLRQYESHAKKGADPLGRSTFRGLPTEHALEDEVFYAGTVTPVLHYCMGGITIDTMGNVLSGKTKQPIPGLHAVGEVTGGVHGNNRLAGNSLLECTVFGTIVGKKLPVDTSNQPHGDDYYQELAALEEGSNMMAKLSTQQEITMEELSKHNHKDDCWVAIHGIVYDLTEFAKEHPSGAEAIYELAGKDGTHAFQTVHSKPILEDFGDDQVGMLKTNAAQTTTPATIDAEEKNATTLLKMP